MTSSYASLTSPTRQSWGGSRFSVGISLLCRDLHHLGNRKAWKMCKAQGVKHRGAESWVSKLIRQWRPPCPRNPLLMRTSCNVCNGEEYWQERSLTVKKRACCLDQCPPECYHRIYEAMAERYAMLARKLHPRSGSAREFR